MGYANKLVRLDFSDLGEGCFVTIRNPKLLTDGQLKGPDLELDEHGRPKDRAAASAASREVMARIVVSWCVWDPEDDADDPPPLPLPATPELVGKLPLEIVARISEELEAAVSPR